MVPPRALLSCLWLLCALGAVSPAALANPAGPEPVNLPIEADLPQTTLVLELRGSEVDLVFDDEAEPSILVNDLLRPESDDGMVMLEQGEGVLHITQPHGDDTLAPRLRVKVVAHPGTAVELSGERLIVSVQLFGAEPLDPVLPPAETTPPPQTAGGADEGTLVPTVVMPRLRLDLRDSSATLAGLGGQLRGQGTHFRLTGIRGPLAAELRGGRLIVEGLAGTLDVRASDADVELRELVANVALQLDHATLHAQSAIGKASGSAHASSVAISDWHGGVSLSGDENRFELRQAGTKETQISLSGGTNQIELEELAAPLTVEAAQGRLVARRLLAPATIRARDGAQLELELVKARLDLELTEAARATVRGADEPVTARVRGGQATLVGIRTLDLTAADATIEGEDIGAARVRATNSSVALDLRAATGSPDLDFGKGTQATLVLPSPCVFSLESAEEARERVELVGCEIYDGRQRLFAPVGKRVILARVKVEAGATLKVSAGS